MVTIERLCRQHGFGDLIVLSRAFFEEYEAHDPCFFRLDNLSDDDVITYFASFLDREDRAAFVALNDDRVVGYITVYVQAQPAFWKIEKLGHISGLMVERGHRRAGIGRQLLAQAQAFFRQQTVEYFTVYTAVQNRGGLDFYRDNGMQPLYQHLLGRVLSE